MSIALPHFEYIAPLCLPTRPSPASGSISTASAPIRAFAAHIPCSMAGPVVPASPNRPSLTPACGARFRRSATGFEIAAWLMIPFFANTRPIPTGRTPPSARRRGAAPAWTPPVAASRAARRFQGPAAEHVQPAEGPHRGFATSILAMAISDAGASISVPAVNARRRYGKQIESPVRPSGHTCIRRARSAGKRSLP